MTQRFARERPMRRTAHRVGISQQTGAFSADGIKDAQALCDIGKYDLEV